jgi:signal transduction histidine kinase
MVPTPCDSTVWTERVGLPVRSVQTHQEVGPDGVDLTLERGEVGAVVDPPRRDRPPVFVACLQRHAAPGVVAVDAARGQPIEAHGERRVDHDHSRVVARALGLDEQRDVVDDDRVGRRLGDAPEELGADGGVGDGLELLARLVRHERLGGQRAAVERPFGREDVGPEPLDELGEGGHAGLDHLPGDRVRVDHDRPPPGQQRCHGRLPGANPTGQADHQHADGVYELRRVLRRCSVRGAPTSATVTHSNTPDGIGRIAVALASAGEAGSRLESRLVALTVASRTITVAAGLLFGTLKSAGPHFSAAAVVLVAYTLFESVLQLRVGSLSRIQFLTIIELVLSVGIIMITGAFKSPFVLTPITPLLLAGYVWGRRATVGTAVAGAIAAAAAIAIQSADVADQRAASQIAVIFLLCGALGAFTRNLVVEIEMQRALAIDQATQMAAANHMLVSLHALAQTLPASFDLGEVVGSIRQRVRALFPYTALVVLVPEDGGSGWRTELGEGVRVATGLAEQDLPQPLRRAMTSSRPVVVTDRIADPDEQGFAALCRSGLYAALRARGALVGAIAIEHEPANAYGSEERGLLESLSSVLALSLDNARWFGRLHTLGAEAERGRIARELHDRIAQSLAYVTFELERLQGVDGPKPEELRNLHDFVREVMQELRQTIYQLRANVSEDNELTVVAADFLARFEERTGITTTWDPQTARRLPYRVEQELWRIVQEALANVERHSEATQVVVRWAVDEHNGARLEISDNGKGFEPSRVAGDRYGIVGMRERAEAIGAHLQIVSRKGRGTSVVVDVETATTRRRPRGGRPERPGAAVGRR